MKFTVMDITHSNTHFVSICHLQVMSVISKEEKALHGKGHITDMQSWPANQISKFLLLKNKEE